MITIMRYIIHMMHIINKVMHIIRPQPTNSVRGKMREEPSSTYSVARKSKSYGTPFRLSMAFIRLAARGCTRTGRQAALAFFAFLVLFRRSRFPSSSVPPIISSTPLCCHCLLTSLRLSLARRCQRCQTRHWNLHSGTRPLRQRLAGACAGVVPPPAPSALLHPATQGSGGWRTKRPGQESKAVAS